MDEFLNYELFNISDFRVTVLSLASTFAIAVVAWIIVVLFAKISKPFFNARKVDEGRQHALVQLVKYFVWTIALVLMLDNAGVKVTILLAGSAALLVGLGFGLQQIFQDLVSGIFILVEGTIRVNDVIELDGLVGRILNIKLRTSSVLTRDGIIIIVPNHKFIVDNIINWSHNAIATRFKVKVGVAYGSDVELVRQILVECARQHEDSITDDDKKQHHPFARFVDFGESSLDFEVYFWSNNIFYIENAKSDIRFMIDKRFRESGVTIPFPQRDIHIKN